MGAAHHVTFRFTLPPTLRSLARAGIWPHAPRGAAVKVEHNGDVEVRSVDYHQTYATNQVLEVAGVFLRSLSAELPLTALIGELSTPATRINQRDPTRYSIALGAKVSITRVLHRDEPTLFGQAI